MLLPFLLGLIVVLAVLVVPFRGVVIGWAFLALFRVFIDRRTDLDDNGRIRFYQVLVLNFLICFASLYFFVFNYSDSAIRFGAEIPTPHHYSWMAAFGIGKRDWLQIALAKFVLSSVVAALIGVPIYLLNSHFMSHYRIGPSAVWNYWAGRVTAVVVILLVLASLTGGYLFVDKRL